MTFTFSRDRPDDRLATAIFVAALLHGLVILGIRFTSPPNDDRALPTLEVLLVPDGPNESPNPDAGYLAQRSQHGFGTTRRHERTSLPEATPSVLENEGAVDGDSPRADQTDETVGGSPVLSSRNFEKERADTGTERERPTQFYAVPQASRPLEQIGVNASAAASELALRGATSPDDVLLADTRESVIAGYLDGWKRRVERVGTLNFPNEARRRSMSGNPVLEVSIRANGSLESVVVRRSSGHRELDNAAVNIVRIASPFDPFPAAMRSRYPVLRFAYEWQFLNGRLGDSAVFSDGR
jgi:protein TonB